MVQSLNGLDNISNTESNLEQRIVTVRHGFSAMMW